MAEILSFDLNKRRNASGTTTPGTRPEVVIMPQIDIKAVKVAWANIDKACIWRERLRHADLDVTD
jgi:hypothetical protein